MEQFSLTEVKYEDLIIRLKEINGKRYIIIYRDGKELNKVKLNKKNKILSFCKLIMQIKHDIKEEEIKRILLSLGLDIKGIELTYLMVYKKHSKLKTKKAEPINYKVLAKKLINLRISKEEKILAWYLNFRKVPFKQQVFLLRKYFVDFLVDNKLVVEVEGKWHRRKDVSERDIKKFTELRLAGYEVLRIPASLIRNNPLEASETVYYAWKKLLR